MKFYSKTINETLENLEVNLSNGLSSNDVKQRQDKYGLNEFTPQVSTTFWDNLKRSLSEPMIIILIVAALLSALIGEVTDAIGIIAAIIIGVGIGLITEGKSKKAADELSKLTENIEVKVLRNGHVQQIPKNQLVPGDIVYIETGDLIPADGRVIHDINLKVREDMLTGESDDVSKSSHLVIEMESIRKNDELIQQDPVPAKQRNMLFGGTLVAYGRGTMVVTSIGDTTEMGRIAKNLSESDEETPLQVKLGGLGATITKISGAIAGILFILMIVNMVKKNILNIDSSSVGSFFTSLAPIKTAFTTCVALIVAAVPEGLPTMINITLAMTMQKMAKINALVTKKEACETIGSVSVICSDKTGTLTENRMSVEVAYVDGTYVETGNLDSHSYFMENCLVNSTADIEKIDNQVKYIGSATECALLVYSQPIDYVAMRQNTELVAQTPFNSELKRMRTIIKKGNQHILLVKGAPEVLLDNSQFFQQDNQKVILTEELKLEILSEIEKLQVKSMRTLGFAYRNIEESDLEESIPDNGLIFSGFVGIKDPLRADVKESVMLANEASVEVKMLTGDNINTARAIGEELGLLTNEFRAVEATYIDTLTDEELQQEIKTISIVARSKPDTKMRIVAALQANGEVVAVTGDGINDAPALSKADVGIAMGISGTEVSKSAADIILTDDSFSTIIHGIQWGRGIYENFQRFIQFQLTVNIIAFLIAIICQLTGEEMPFTTIQLLWVNIIMDGPPALVLGLEPARRHILTRKPISRRANIITNSMKITILSNAIFITFVLLLQLKANILNATSAEMGTVMFSIFAFSALFNAFNCREFGTDSIIPNFMKNTLAIKVILCTGIAQILFTQIFREFFNSVPLSFMMWVKVVALASIIIIVNEIVKFILRKVKRIQIKIDNF